MDIDAVSAPLRERLGPEATGGLLDLFDLARSEWRNDLIAACTDRYERRLAEEIAGVRVQIAQVEASLRTEIAQTGAGIRQEMAQMGAGIRQEMAQMGAGMRQEMAEMGAQIRQDMAQMGAQIRQETGKMGAQIRQEMGEMGSGIRTDMATGRVELFKWCFLFWIGQVVAVSTIVGLMLRLMR